MAKWTKQKPHLEPHIGCLNCGGGEMNHEADVILAEMETELYFGFGGWTVTLNGELHFQADPEGDSPLLLEIERETAKSPDNDWRIEYHGAMRDATYQRQGENRWVLIASGPGFA